MINKEIVKISVTEASKLDREVRSLVNTFSVARIRVGLELGKRLNEIEVNKLYSKIDRESYPTFVKYISSLGISYKSAMELMGLYRTFVLAGGFTIDYLAEIPYRKLTEIKPILFKKEKGEYKLDKSMTEAKRWISDAKSDMSIDDLRQKKAEVEAGEHEHNFLLFRKCKLCRLVEFVK